MYIYNLPHNDLSQDYLKTLLEYNFETGIFTWIKPGNMSRVGKIAGSVAQNGYICISIGRKGYKAHRLAWLYYYGVWPKNQIDHINGIKTDNRISNLREATVRQNSQNRLVHRSGKFPGIRLLGNKWQVRIWHNGSHVHLGVYANAEEAYEVYIDGLKSLGYCIDNLVEG